MLKWASILCSLLALATFAVVGFAEGEKVRQGCVSDPIVLPLPPQCGMLTTISSGFLGLGIFLTMLVLFVHSLVAAQKGSWRWLFTLLVVPPLWFLFSMYGVNPPAARADFFPSLVFLPIGLPNLLFSIFVFPSGHRAARSSLYEDAPSC